MQRNIAVACVVSLLLASAFAMPVAGSSTTTGESLEEPAFHVDLEADGDATVSLVSVYDLSDDDERDAFESLQDDETTQGELLDRFADRMGAVATEVEADAEREMAVTGESVAVETTDELGIVTLSVYWEGLAATDDDALVVAEPFDSGFDADRPLVVTAPTDATIESTTPDPTTHDDAQMTWDEGTSLDGFEVTVSLSSEAGDEAAPGTDEDGASDAIPGFGVAVAAIAIALVVTSLGGNRR